MRGSFEAGWEEVDVENGKIVNVEDGKSLYPSFAECLKLGESSQPTNVPLDLSI
jgi:hypothetical protein